MEEYQKLTQQAAEQSAEHEKLKALMQTVLADDVPDLLYVNLKAFRALSPEYKAYVEMASTYAHVETQAKYDARNPGALKQLVATGAKLRPFPADVMTEAFRQSMALYDELSRRNENWKKVYAAYSKFRAEQNLWFRFTEATFDRFMQQQKLG